MCGIYGLVSRTRIYEKQEIEKNLEFLRHRGPDDSGIFNHNNVFLGHTRLSIIDIKNGHQPMTSECGNYTIVFNGEIYNYRELASKFNINANTNSDTEILLRCYEMHKEKCLDFLRGMFAFVIYDKKKNSFFMARDHFGIKPLYLYQDSEKFVFSSELKPIKQSKGVDLTKDLKAIDTYLRLNYIPAPFSAFEKIRKLKPGHFATLDLNSFQFDEQCYYQFSFENKREDRTINELIEEFDCVFEDSVNKHLVSDVPFGAFLSGGIDSSLIVSKMHKKLGAQVKAFTIDFAGDLSESKYAKEVAQKYDLEHHVERVEPNSIELLDDIVDHSGEPFGDSSILPMYYLSKVAKKHVTMALSGDGADEFFGGYNSYARWYSRNNRKNSNLKSRFQLGVSRYLKGKKNPIRNLDNWLKESTGLKNDIRSAIWKSGSESNYENEIEFMQNDFDQNNNLDVVQQAQVMDIKYLLQGDMLPKVDIASMMNSLEVRTPFIDIEVANFVSNLQSSSYFKISKKGLEAKLLLKDLLGKEFDNDFVNRPKHGFTVPLKDWFSKDQRFIDLQNHYFNSEESPLLEIFDGKVLKGIYNSNNKNHIWSQLILGKWIENH